MALVVGVAAPAQAAAGPTARWNADTGGSQYVPQNRPITLNGSSSSSAISGGLKFAWYVNGSLQRGQTGSTFTTSPLARGTYLIRMTVTDAAGKSASLSQTFIAVPWPPTVVVKPVTYKTLFLGESITYDMNSSTVEPGSRKYAWRVNGSTVPGQTGSTFRFTPSTTGTYSIMGLITDSYGQTRGTGAPTVTVYRKSAPIASFTPRSTASIVVGQKLYLNASASKSLIGGDLKYVWWERGTPYVGRDDPRIYMFWPTYAGKHRVTLVVTDRAGQTARQDIVIDVVGKRDPVAYFTPESSVVPVGSTLRFDARRSYDPDGGALKYYWWTTGIPGIVSNTNSYSRRFTAAGKYRVRLAVVDNEYATTSKTVEITVNTPPIASFTPSRNTTVNAGQLVTFDGSASRDPDRGGLSYYWTVRGHKGAASKSNKLYWRFAKPGKYGVQLDVTDSLGGTSKQWIEVTVVNNPPVASFTPGDQTIRKNTVLTFDGSRSSDPAGGRLTYSWTTSEVKGEASRASKFAYRFKNEGEFGVQLVVKNQYGVTGKKWVRIKVTP